MLYTRSRFCGSKLARATKHYLKGDWSQQPQFAKWKLINGKQDSGIYTSLVLQGYDHDQY